MNNMMIVGCTLRVANSTEQLLGHEVEASAGQSVDQNVAVLSFYDKDNPAAFQDSHEFHSS